MTDARRLVDRLWSFCHVLRDDGVGAVEYVEQLTYLLFLKMADERGAGVDGWRRLAATPTAEVYRDLLTELARGPGALGTVYAGARNRIQDPAKLRRLVGLIDAERWSAGGPDVAGDAYEELLSRCAEDVKSGAGQYFTPRPVIQAVVACVRPAPHDTVIDPAAGTGGFLLAAHTAAPAAAKTGVELVDGTARLAAMNLILHGAGTPTGPSPVEVGDALAADDGRRYSVVLSNPPFGRRAGERAPARADFTAATGNKQLNFVQHIATILRPGGRAAVVVPDNVLFEGGAGEVVRRRLLRDFDLHTMLRLPTGIFYAQGVKANVLFFDRTSPSGRLWVYDLRTGVHCTLKQDPLRREHLDDFVAAYRPGEPPGSREPSARFRPFEHADLLARERTDLDLTWPAGPGATPGTGPGTGPGTEPGTGPGEVPGDEPHRLARAIVAGLTAALREFEAVADALGDPVHADQDGKPPEARRL